MSGPAPRPRWRRLVGMGIFSLVMVCLLIALGIWQVHRWHYKDRIAAEIRAAQIKPPVKLTARPTPYEKVELRGEWVGDRAAFFGDQIRNSPTGPLQGGQLIMPFRRQGGAVVLVDLGWVRGRRPKPVPVPAGPAAISGYVHKPAKAGIFAARNDPADRIFYSLDPAAIGAALGVPKVAPYVLVVLGPKPIAGGPIPAPALPLPPNNSRQYALTWFGLALVVVCEFVFYARKRLMEAA